MELFYLHASFGCSLFKQRELFCFEFELFGAQPFWVRLSQLRTEKSSLVTYLVLLPYMQALFMTSLRCNAGHKMAALTVIFQRGTKKGVKNCCEYIFCNPYLSIEPVMLSLVRFSKVTCSVSSAFTPHECGSEVQEVIWRGPSEPGLSGSTCMSSVWIKDSV